MLSRTTLAEILKFVNEVPFAAIRFILDSAKLNCALSQEGLSGKWGLHIGATLEKQCARGLLGERSLSSIVIRTSAASDARMGGATLPAMSNSGSGNQGITATMPVVVVAEHFGADDERLARARCFRISAQFTCITSYRVCLHFVPQRPQQWGPPPGWHGWWMGVMKLSRWRSAV